MNDDFEEKLQKTPNKKCENNEAVHRILSNWKILINLSREKIATPFGVTLKCRLWNTMSRTIFLHIHQKCLHFYDTRWKKSYLLSFWCYKLATMRSTRILVIMVVKKNNWWNLPTMNLNLTNIQNICLKKILMRKCKSFTCLSILCLKCTNFQRWNQVNSV